MIEQVYHTGDWVYVTIFGMHGIILGCYFIKDTYSAYPFKRDKMVYQVHFYGGLTVCVNAEHIQDAYSRN